MSDYTTFEPRTYLAEYYGSIAPDTLDLLRFMVTTFQQLPAPARVLDFGGGPTLYAALVTAGRAGEIHLSDYAAANRAELEAWLRADPDAFGWEAFVATVLELEGQAATPDAVRRREAAVRACVTRVLPCDAAATPPIAPQAEDAGRPPTYDLLITNLCLEAAAADATTWRRYVEHVAALLRPGGCIMMATVRRARAYPVGERLFPIVYLDEADILAALGAAGFDPASLQIAVVPSDHPLYPYEGLILTSALKAS